MIIVDAVYSAFLWGCLIAGVAAATYLYRTRKRK